MGIQAFVWTPNIGAVEIGDLPGGANGVPHSYARAISDDGSLVACIGQSDNGDESFLYNVATGAMTPLGDLPGGSFGSYAYGMSRDGVTIVGLSYSGNGQEAFRWTQTGGIHAMGFLPTLPTQSLYSSAEATNADGSVIVGESAKRQHRWQRIRSLPLDPRPRHAAPGRSPRRRFPELGLRRQQLTAPSSSAAAASPAPAASSAAAPPATPSSGTPRTACATSWTFSPALASTSTAGS